jgi:Reverse transcriptase (RNA-dependent DNA polymerase).
MQNNSSWTHLLSSLRICVDGSQQQHGIDYHDTYLPVVSWTMVRCLLLIISKLLNLSSCKVDYVQAFPQVPLDNEDVYMELTAGYTVKLANKNVVLKLIEEFIWTKTSRFH